MPDDWPSRFTREALARIDAYIAAHPEYTLRGVEQPAQGATNRVIFARRDGELIVFKVFCEAERKERECFALRHWREISRYLSYDGTPGLGCAWASPADPVAYHKSMEAAERLLTIDGPRPGDT